jgi:hypothetical protein
LGHRIVAAAQMAVPTAIPMMMPIATLCVAAPTPAPNAIPAPIPMAIVRPAALFLVLVLDLRFIDGNHAVGSF